MRAKRTNKNVEYAVNDLNDKERIFKTLDEAASFALTIAMSVGESVLDILVYSEGGAEFVAGDEGLEQYREDENASVFDRYEIKVNRVGSVP